MARYDTYRTVARQERYEKERRAAGQAIEDAYDALLAAKADEEQFTLDDYGTPAERAAFRARRAAEDALYALDPKHSYWS